MNWEKLLNNNRLRQSKGRDPKDARNDFESDFGRIIFSPAIRRMHDKTQVFPLTTDDNIHSRLTHSMEVMSIGYSLGVKLCENKEFQKKLDKLEYELFREIPVILKNSCLVHDIGNPPFGHFGESVIQNYFLEFFDRNIVKEKQSDFNESDKKTGKILLELSDNQKLDFLHFDGNAQGLRVLTKLQMLNDIYGLNLTYATLGSYIKYPNYGSLDDDIIAKHKIGVFDSEIEFFDKIVRNCGLEIDGNVVRHPLCYLMEAADTICYLTMDIEDGYSKGLFDLKYLYKELKTIPSLSKALKKIYKDEDDIYKNDLTKVVNFRIKIIQELVLLAVSNFNNNIHRIENGSYNEELIFEDKNGLAKKL